MKLIQYLQLYWNLVTVQKVFKKNADHFLPLAVYYWKLNIFGNLLVGKIKIKIISFLFVFGSFYDRVIWLKKNQ